MCDCDKGIDYSDIPKITDLSNAIKNPFAGKFKDGYTIVVEHEDYDEIITVSKSRRAKVSESAIGSK